MVDVVEWLFVRNRYQVELARIVLDVANDGRHLARADNPGVSLAPEHLLQAAHVIGTVVDIRRDIESTENTADREISQISLREDFLALKVANAPDVLSRHNVQIIVEQLDDVL